MPNDRPSSPGFPQGQPPLTSSRGRAFCCKPTKVLPAPLRSDAHICQALHVGRMTVERTRQTCVAVGLEAALTRKQRATPGQQKFDGDKEAHLIAVACANPPQGQKRWTLHLLADKMVELQHFASISHETIRQHRKKVN